ncbi:MAG: acyl-CoA dehydrogenase family protein, partial [candidate division Zixibacteria bacterium]
MRRDIDPKQAAIREKVKAFADKEIYPISQEMDQMPEPRKFPRELYGKLGKAGFIGLSMPKELGGRDGSHLEYITQIEELCYHDAAVGLLCAIGELATFPILFYGSDELKKKWVPKCAAGDVVPAFVLTERDAGSDAANQKTTAVETDDGFVINGEKIFIMHGDAADIAVIFCKVEGRPKLSAILVETDQPGYQARVLKQKMGMRAATTAGIILKDVKAPKGNLLGEFGRGFRYAMGTLDSARVGVAGQALGVAQRALDESVAYAKKRVQFGAPIAKLQAIQWMIADMATRVQAARGLAYRSAQLQDSGEKFSLEAAMAKLYCSETANFCVDR